MNDNFPRSDWYGRPAPVAPPAAPARKSVRKPRAGVKVAAISALVLLVLVGSVYAFSDSFGLPRSARSDGDGNSHSFTFEIGPGVRDDAPDAPDALPEEYDRDYRDFFSRYYDEAAMEQDEASSIARAETGSAFRLTLESAEGQRELTRQELYAACVDSVVGIRSRVKGALGYYWGTGIILSEDGYILTNQHILSGTDSASVVLPDGTEAAALLVGEDVQMDVAVLKIEASGLHPATFGDSSALTVGDDVVAIGNPLSDSLSGTMTNGIISAIDRSVTNNGHPITMLQTNAAINEGNSGGPLFNMYGQVVGITNMKMVNPYSDVTVEGLGFAIPSVTVKAVADQLLANGAYVRPGIGITVGAIDRDSAEHYDLPDGLYISAVSDTSDAAAKGVKPGDILTHVNGIPVRRTDDVLAIRDAMQVGDTLTLTLYRDGETFDVEIELFVLGNIY